MTYLAQDPLELDGAGQEPGHGLVHRVRLGGLGVHAQLHINSQAT